MDSSPEALSGALSRVAVVLYEPQDDINIGNTVRACKNFGIRDIRLVRPRVADPDRISISAPKARDVVDSLRRFDTLADAVADCAVVMGSSARQRKVKRLYLEPRTAARELVSHAEGDAHVAIMFGREDSGLPNAALDVCHAIVTVPTDPTYSSLNLGQAVLLMVWEIFRVAQGVQEQSVSLAQATPETPHPLASGEDMERLFAHAERALTLIDFIKPESHRHMRRTLRSMFQRLGLDTREISIWRGVFAQIQWAVGESYRRGADGRDPLEDRLEE
jgi:TrmH family RNA methyltransferase